MIGYWKIRKIGNLWDVEHTEYSLLCYHMGTSNRAADNLARRLNMFDSAMELLRQLTEANMEISQLDSIANITTDISLPHQAQELYKEYLSITPYANNEKEEYDV